MLLELVGILQEALLLVLLMLFVVFVIRGFDEGSRIPADLHAGLSSQEYADQQFAQYQKPSDSSLRPLPPVAPHSSHVISFITAGPFTDIFGGCLDFLRAILFFSSSNFNRPAILETRPIFVVYIAVLIIIVARTERGSKQTILTCSHLVLDTYAIAASFSVTLCARGCTF